MKQQFRDINEKYGWTVGRNICQKFYKPKVLGRVSIDNTSIYMNLNYTTKHFFMGYAGSLIKVREDRRNRSNLINFAWKIARWLPSQTDPKSTLTVALLVFGSESSVKHRASHTNWLESLASSGFRVEYMRESYQPKRT